ncbi:MAG TPA: class I SAM-dependent methyltransferase [Gaiellaceae bacterium]|nr:class I SAM-dependent methyltransferase [Gaiellaceae bacterium]
MSTWSDRAYADPVPYLRHRAELVLSLGPPLGPGGRLCDLACGDGGLADFLPGIDYVGVDSDPQMVAEGRSKGRELVQADLNDFEPDHPVAATTIFRAIYYSRDRLAFFRRVAGYTDRKLVFDLNPRQYRLADVAADLRAAGLPNVAVRPFFVPQTLALPGPVGAALVAAERAGPLARLALRFKFTYLVAASR